MSDFDNYWFSTAMGIEVVLLHSKFDKLNDNPREKAILKREGDKAKCFVFDGAIHLCNEASIRDLTSRVAKKYPESDREKYLINTVNFRPNILVDTKEAYSEDQFVEMRIA